jgi:hypothetical protein
MNRQTLVATILGLALMAGAAMAIHQVGARQVLAPPGVKTHSMPGSIRLEAELPERVLDCDSKTMEITDTELAVLPKDTSFGKRRYRAADGLLFDLQVVLMGKDRTSMHKPQICLTGQGWHIDDVASKETVVEVTRPFKYNLPVVELVASQTFKINGEAQRWSGVYVYWFVADDAMSASTSGLQRMWWMASHLLRTGVLQRWAYVSCFVRCPPGQEPATFERMKQFINAAVPEFQLYPRPQSIVAIAAP